MRSIGCYQRLINMIVSIMIIMAMTSGIETGNPAMSAIMTVLRDEAYLGNTLRTLRC